MAKRPADYGDQYPSDSADVSPGDPTDGFSEVDYEVSAFDGKKRKAKADREFFPDAQQRDDELVDREHWAGVIVEVSNGVDIYPRVYQVLRDDGRLVEAFSYEVLPSEEFKPGHDVIIQRVTKDPETFNVTGKTRAKELQVLQVKISSGTYKCFAGQTTVPFDEIDLRLPPEDIDDQFTDPAPANVKLKLFPPGIQSKFDEETLCTISFTLNVKLNDPRDISNPIHVTEGCWKPDVFERVQPNKAHYSSLLWFNRENGFRVEYDTNDCSIVIMLASKCEDSILNQQDKEKAAFFTDSPKLGGNLSLGTKKPGWLMFGTEDQPRLWLSDGGGELKFRFPVAPPSYNGAFFVADKVSGSCVQGGWLEPGVSGNITFQTNIIDSYITHVIYGYTINIPLYKSCTLTVDRGIITNGCGLSPNTQTGGAVCYVPYSCEDHQCDE